jgi:hypothetical protein
MVVLLIGTTLSVNIFLASAPVLDSMPTLASLARVPVFTHSDEDIKENPERLIFRYIIPNASTVSLTSLPNNIVFYLPHDSQGIQRQYLTTEGTYSESLLCMLGFHYS